LTFWGNDENDAVQEEKVATQKVGGETRFRVRDQEKLRVSRGRVQAVWYEGKARGGSGGGGVEKGGWQKENLKCP